MVYLADASSLAPAAHTVVVVVVGVVGVVVVVHRCCRTPRPTPT